MDRSQLLAELQRALVVKVQHQLPIPDGNVGIVVVDAVCGFTRSGNLADPSSMSPMVQALNRFIRAMDRHLASRLQLMVVRDRHHADVPEPPYPPHCVIGSGEEQLDPELSWMEDHLRTAIIDKDCINGFVGAMRPCAALDVSHPSERTANLTQLPSQAPMLYRNLLVEWVLEHQLQALIIAGDCTDICVSDLTVAMLSARNHGLLTTHRPENREAYVNAITSMSIFVYAPGCATFDLDPNDVTELPGSDSGMRHPAQLSHHVGLWMMASRGAQVIDGFARLHDTGISA